MGHRALRVVGSGLMIFGLGLSPVMAAEPESGMTEEQPAGEENASIASPAQPAAAEPTIEQVRDAVQKYVQETTQEEGIFYVDDEVTGDTRELTLNQIHDTVGKAGDYYSVCADMKDDKTGELLDIDFDVESYEGELEVVDVRIHKSGGKERYTYDASGNRLPAQ